MFECNSTFSSVPILTIVADTLNKQPQSVVVQSGFKFSNVNATSRLQS